MITLEGEFLRTLAKVPFLGAHKRVEKHSAQCLLWVARYLVRCTWLEADAELLGFLLQLVDGDLTHEQGEVVLRWLLVWVAHSNVCLGREHKLLLARNVELVMRVFLVLLLRILATTPLLTGLLGSSAHLG